MPSNNVSLLALKNIDIKTVGLVLFAIVLIVLNLPRIHFNIFWCDECFSILSASSFDSFIEMGVGDACASPVLYYFMIFAFRSLFGGTPETYQILSFIPWILMLTITIVIIRKEFGYAVAFIFMIFCSLLTTSMGYITEARSYEWDALFVLLSFLSLYGVLKTHQTKYYCYFVIASLLGAYSHYYCLLAVAFFYLILLIESLHNKKYLKNFFIAFASSIIGYIPWLIVALDDILSTTKNFWITVIPTIKESIEWMFGYGPGYSSILPIIMAVTSIYLVVKYIRNNKNDQKMHVALWIIAGLSSVFGSVVVASIASDILTPLVVIRYYYPVSIVAWLLLSYSIVHCWENIDLKKAVTITTVMFLLFIGVPTYQNIMGSEMRMNANIEDTLSKLDCIEEGDYIYSDVPYFDWTVLDYYLPGIEHSKGFANPQISLPEIDKTRQNYFFIVSPMNDQIRANLEAQGLGYVMIKEGANLGGKDSYYFNAYKIVPLIEAS